MTPTLLGRIQTRLLLFVTIGLPVTLLFALAYGGLPLIVFPFWFIAAITVLGLLLDPLYILIQKFRWDNDWPFAFQFFFSIIEFLAVYGLVAGDLLPFSAPPGFGFWTALLHFSLVFIPSFLFLLGGLQIFFVRWRFKGGELGRHSTSP